LLATLGEREHQRGHTAESLRLFEEAWRIDESLLTPAHSERTGVLVPYVSLLSELHEARKASGLMKHWLGALSKTANARASAMCAVDVAGRLAQRGAVEAAAMAAEFAITAAAGTPGAAEYDRSARAILARLSVSGR
jgi:hypothetical protein